MIEAYVTVGQRYRTEEHPTYPKAHPDGWVTIEAESQSEVYKIVSANFCGDPDCTRPYYSMIYWSKKDLHPEQYPLGEIGRFSGQQAQPGRTRGKTASR